MRSKRLLLIVAIAASIIVAGIWLYRRRATKPSIEVEKLKAAGKVRYSEVPDCVSIENPIYDQDDSDSDADADACTPLACAVTTMVGLKGVAAQDIIHNSNQQAISQLSACVKSRQSSSNVLIIGHGSSGTIYTALSSGYGGFFAPGNYPWDNVMQELVSPQKKPSITIWGCSVGTDPYGAKLLKNIKEESQSASVRAPKVDVFCDSQGLYFINGQDWLSDPEIHTSIASLSDRERATNTHSKIVSRPKSGILGFPITPTDLREVTLLERGLAPSHLTKLIDIKLLVDAVGTKESISTSGCPFARKIGKLVLRLNDAKVKPRVFTVFENGLLHDLNRSDVQLYYPTSDAFVSTWRHLLDSKQPPN